jgi:hypothetical protein
MVMAEDLDGAARLKEYFDNPGNGIAFVMASADPAATKAEFILIVSGEHIIGKIDFDEAWNLADFLYTRLPPRAKDGVQ